VCVPPMVVDGYTGGGGVGLYSRQRGLPAGVYRRMRGGAETAFRYSAWKIRGLGAGSLEGRRATSLSDGACSRCF